MAKLVEAPKQEFQPVRQIERQHARVGRNDPCPCGSGKKAKRCHLHEGLRIRAVMANYAE